MSGHEPRFEDLAVAVTNADDEVKGTGWLITPRAVVTCDHVVRDCGFTGEGSSIRVRGHVVEAVERYQEKDLAVLRLDADADSEPARLSRDWAAGEQLFSRGFDGRYPTSDYPKGHSMDVGVLAGAPITRRLGGQDRELLVVNGVDVDGGMSGAPVWPQAEHGIIGVMTRSDKTVNAYITPIDELLERWPEFETLHRARPPEAFAVGGLTPIQPDVKVWEAIGLPARRPPIAAGIDNRLVGRDDALADLAWRVAQGHDVTVATEPKTYAVHGLGGIGKTALALEFCHQHRNRFSLVWWANAETAATLSESYRQLAHHLRLPYQSDEDARAQVVAHLRKRVNWLAVFDNVADRDSLAEARPDAPSGQIIATSRNPHDWVNPLPLPPIDDEPAKGWIVAAAGDPADDSETAAAAELAEHLGGLALALAMATSFIRQTGCTISEYLSFYQDDELLADEAGVPTDYEESVYTAWAVSIERLGETNPPAKRLLEYLAFCAPDQIPIRIFTPESLRTEPSEPLRASAINGAIRGLLEYSLASREGSHLWIHRLVQTATRHYLSSRPS